MPLDWHVTVNGLVRKALVICDNLAIAVAGNGWGASAVVNNLRTKFAASRPNADEFFAHLQTIDDALSEMTKCSVLGWLIDGDLPRSFSWVSSEPDFVHWDGEYMTGTGASLFKAMAWSDAQPTWNITSFDTAQHYGLEQISSLFINELTNGISVANWFGGGYDLLLWDGERFRLGSDVSFLFLSLDWLLSPTKAASDRAPILLRQMEIEDCLVLRAVLPENDLGVASDSHERAAIIAPITSVGRQYRFGRPHAMTEVPLFADRIFAVVSGIGSSGSLEHWSGGIDRAQAAQFEIEQLAGTNKVRFHLPSGVMDAIGLTAERQIRRKIT